MPLSVVCSFAMFDLAATTVGNDLMGFVKFVGDFAPLFGIPVGIAVIERPFYTAAGVKPQTAWWSIQANVVGMFASSMGSCFYGFFSIFRGTEFLACVVMSIVLLSGIKCFYLRIASDGRFRPRWAWVFAANGTSVFAAIVFIEALHRLDRPNYRVAVQPYSANAGLLLGWTCLTAIIAAFIVPFFGQQVRHAIAGRWPARPSSGTQ